MGSAAKCYCRLFANLAVWWMQGSFLMSKNNRNPLIHRSQSTSAKPGAFARALGFAEAGSQNQRFSQIDRLCHSVMLRALHRFLVEKVKPQRVFSRVGFREKTVPQLHPFLLPDLTLEDRFLHASPVIRARPRHPAQPPPARLLDGRDIVSDQDQHGVILEPAADIPADRRGDGAP